MRRHNGGRLYSARDLDRFLECRHCTWIDLLDLEVPHDRTTADEQTLLVREKGIEHEQAYLDSLRDRGLSVVEIPTNKPLEHRVEQTRTAIGDGVDAIYQAALMSGSWHGFADFLRRTGSNPARYECIDTKLGRTPPPTRNPAVSALCAIGGNAARHNGKGTITCPSSPGSRARRF